MNMEEQTSGFDVLRFAKEQHYRPAVAILTANPDLCTGGRNRAPRAFGLNLQTSGSS